MNEAIFFIGVVGIVDGERDRISEGGGGLLERDAVLGEIAPRLLRVPLESDRQEWSSSLVRLWSEPPVQRDVLADAMLPAEWQAHVGLLERDPAIAIGAGSSAPDVQRAVHCPGQP